jgi:hypothetical protein
VYRRPTPALATLPIERPYQETHPLNINTILIIVLVLILLGGGVSISGACCAVLDSV